MTLLVAAIEGNELWMVADTSITNPAIGSSVRTNRPKIYSLKRRSLIGFAGDVQCATHAIEKAARLPSGSETLSALFSKHTSSNFAVEFAYAFIEGGRPRLFKVAEGHVVEVQTLHLGDHASFEKLQRIRHDPSLDHPPDAIVTYVFGSRGKEGKAAPRGLIDTAVAFFRLFPLSSNRSVGGVVVPYLLSDSGVELCTYAFSATDPLVNDLKTGMTIPHGSPERGGYSLSVTELAEGDGLVVYWLQKPGGTVFIQSGGSFDAHEIAGNPSEFKAEARNRTNRDVETWFGEEPLGGIDSVQFLNDQNGSPRIGITKSGSNFSFTWVQGTEASFKAGGSMKINASGNDGNVQLAMGQLKLNAAVSADKRNVKLELHGESERLCQELSADELDRLIVALANVRSVMNDPIAGELAPGKELRAVVDPAWRTRPTFHLPIDGFLLALRDPGLGWLSFVLPTKEAAALGGWLQEAAKQK